MVKVEGFSDLVELGLGFGGLVFEAQGCPGIASNPTVPVVLEGPK